MNSVSDNQPAITREEYKVLKSVCDRLGVSDIFDETDFFRSLYSVSFSKFLTNQPQAVMALAVAASGGSERSVKAVRDFVESLATINAFIQDICGAYDILVEADKLCEVMDGARIAYK